VYLLFGTAFIISALLIKVLIAKAPKWGLVDIPIERSEHKKPIPRGAGIGFFIAYLIGISLFSFELVLANWLVFLAIVLVFGAGILDDRYNLKPSIKFLIIIIATSLLYLDGTFIDDVGSYLGVPVTLGWLAFPFTLFAVVGFTNALNLIDGLDGLAASVSIVSLFAFFTIGYLHYDQFMMILSGALIASLFAFLIYNWSPASIFMGDSGSLTLGFMISLLAVKSLDYISTTSVLFITAVPLLDTISAMIRRKRNKKSMIKADKCHIHHILHTFFDQNTPKTVLVLTVIQVAYTLIGFYMDKEIDQTLPFALFTINVIIVYVIVKYMIKQQCREC
jgi:UDP-GlcNAc:undecaprenyl-phosphate GlcNAc-1-phosphate transferase